MIGTLTLIGVAMVGSLFSMDAWNNITFTAAEVKRPGRDLPLSLLLGTGIVISLYMLANVAYLRVLPILGEPGGTTAVARGIEYAADGRVATAVLEVIFGPAGAIVMATAILISTFGCNNGLILSGARIYYAMAKDRLFFRSAGSVNRFHAPGVALVMQGSLGLVAVPLRNLRAIAGFSDFRRGDFLHPDSAGIFRPALAKAGNASTLSCFRVSCLAGAVHCDGRFRRGAVAALQAAVHLAGSDHRPAWDSGLLALEIGSETIGRLGDSGDL